MSDRYWDSNCFMAVFNNEAPRIEKCKSVLMAAERGELSIVTSALTLTEVIKIKGGKHLPQDAEDQIRAFFEHEWIVVRDVDRFIAEKARDFIWKYNLQPYDAIHLATAYRMKIQHLDTYDRVDFGKLDGKVGVPLMKIGEPPLIPFQIEIQEVEPRGKSSNNKPRKTSPRKKHAKLT